MPVRDHHQDEGGFALVLVALSLVALLVFAALVVDIGGVYAKRRDDQNAADVSALAAVMELGGAPGTREARMVAAVKQEAHTALGTTLSDAQWNSCPLGGAGEDRDPGVLQNQIAGASCISYNSVRVRVRLPDQYWKTTFGAVVGRDEIRHSAFAIAGIEPDGFGGVLPFAVTGVSGTGGLGCLKSNSNGQASALCGSTSGNFGFLDFSHYGSATLGTAQSCGNGDANGRIERNTAMGVDHDLSVVSSVHVNPLADTDGCSALVDQPDAAYTITGNMENEITRGMFSKGGANPNYSDGKPARLQRKDDRLFAGGGRRVSGVGGVDDLDDNALWRFIPAGYGPEFGTADIPRSCQRNQFVNDSGSYYPNISLNAHLDPEVRAFLSGLSTREQMIALLNRCFQHYMGKAWDGTPVGSFQTTSGGHEPPSGCSGPCSDPVFVQDSDPNETPNLYDIQYTPRFGYVPVIPEFPNGKKVVPFIRFRAVFIQRLVIEQGGKKYLFDPGFGPSYSGFSGDSDDFRDINNHQRVGEVLVFAFPDGMLPGGLAGEMAPYEIGVNRFPQLVR